MEFPKKLMKMTELCEMGFSEHMLRLAARESPMAFKVNPAAKNSTVWFDTDELAKWMKRQAKLTNIAIGGSMMKRNMMIGTISLLSELGIWAAVFLFGALLTRADYLVILVVAGGLAGLAALVVWSILDVNLRGGRKRCGRN